MLKLILTDINVITRERDEILRVIVMRMKTMMTMKTPQSASPQTGYNFTVFFVLLAS